MSSVLRPLTASATYRRWAFLILGGALLVPYVMLANALGVLVEGFTDDPTPLAWFVMVAGTFVAVVATASVTTVRTVMATGAKELLRGRMDEVTPGRARSWPDRLRTTGWLLAHIVIGGAISVLSLAVPITAVIALVAPFAGPDLLRDLLGAPLPALWRAPWVPFAGVAGVLALIYLVAATGALLARLGQLLLGPSADERVAAAERRAADLAQRNRLARELHDSVGHALSVVTMQAAAANRVLADDPAFAGQALTAIESQARTALEDLDHVLGLLRQDSPTAPQPTLADLDRLLADTRAAGMDLDAAVSGDLDRLPRVVSREAYRIIQQCLTNALRHAAGAPVVLRVSGADDHLEIDVRNPHGGHTAASRASGGGRGLAGIGERATILGGQMHVSDTGGQWRVQVRVPVTTGTPAGRGRPKARP